MKNYPKMQIEKIVKSNPKISSRHPKIDGILV